MTRAEHDYQDELVADWHGHGGGHDHGVGPDADRRYLIIAFGPLIAFMITEVVVAFASGSLALLSDAGHMLAG